MSERLLSQLAHVEVLTPVPEESHRFYRDVVGLEESGREGQSVYLRGWGERFFHSLQLTEAASPGRLAPGRVPGRGCARARARDLVPIPLSEAPAGARLAERRNELALAASAPVRAPLAPRPTPPTRTDGLRPAAHRLAHGDELTKVVRVMVGHQQNRPQNRVLRLARRDRPPRAEERGPARSAAREARREARNEVADGWDAGITLLHFGRTRYILTSWPAAGSHDLAGSGRVSVNLRAPPPARFTGRNSEALR